MRLFRAVKVCLRIARRREKSKAHRKSCRAESNRGRLSTPGPIMVKKQHFLGSLTCQNGTKTALKIAEFGGEREDCYTCI